MHSFWYHNKSMCWLNNLHGLQDWYLASGQSLEPIDATVRDDRGPLPGTFFLHTMWMFGCTKPTSEVTAVAHSPPCRYHLGLGIYNVQTAVEGMDGNKRSHVAFVRAIAAPRPHPMSCRGRTLSVDPHNGTFLCCRNGRTCLGHAMCSDNGIAHQSARPVHSRTLWCRQVKIDGSPHPRPDRNRHHQ